jgi:hypothetical protein
MDQIADLSSTAQAEINEVKAFYEKTIAQLTEYYNGLIDNAKAKAKEDMEWNTFYDDVDAIDLLVSDDYDTKAELKADYNKTLENINYYVTWFADYKINADEIAQYMFDERSKVLDQSATNYKGLIDSLKEFRDIAFTMLKRI